MAGRYWREAASLIIIGRQIKSQHVIKNKNLISDYNVLFMKRSTKSRFMPATCVFPGGTLDEADLSAKWLELFEQHGYANENITKMIKLTQGRPEYYEKKPPEGLLPELSFRLCALRETFEETGLLLVSSTDPKKPYSTTFTDLDAKVLGDWRRKIHGSAVEFLDLFKEIGRLPAVFNLHEWSDWLTPTNFGTMKSRFDTAFFVTFLNEEIPTPDVEEKDEADEFLVLKPIEILEQHLRGPSLMAPPQLYEIRRLLNFSKMEYLLSFSEARSKRGLQRYCPVIIKVKDGGLSVLPGDDLYPKEPDVYEYEDIILDQTMKESRQSCQRIHRIEFPGGSVQNANILMNIKDYCGHKGINMSDMTDAKL